jgi:hypothetical protein
MRALAAPTMTRGRLRQPFFLALVQITVLTGVSLFGVAQAFSTAATSRDKAQLSATKSPDIHTKSSGSMTQEYTDQELKEALGSLLEGSKDPAYDARHIFGYGDDNHNMSMLQRITATRILDYREIMVRTLLEGEEIVHFGYTVLLTLLTLYYL